MSAPGLPKYSAHQIRSNIESLPFACPSLTIMDSQSPEPKTIALRAETTVVDQHKLTRYLLTWQAENDKSGYLRQAGFTAANPELLKEEILRLGLSTRATQD